ncbi:MAG: hypothetical protein ACPGN3_09100 [Opitutales bacterium]
MNSDSLKEPGISRIDTDSTHGWYVRAYRNGKVRSKFFSDRKHGDKEAALEEARRHRDELFETVAKQPKEPRKRSPQISAKRSGTGVVGVTRTDKRSANGNLLTCYSVSWRPEPNVQKCTSFSWEKYGEQEAFRMAVTHRFERLIEAYGTDIEDRLLKEHHGNERVLSIVSDVFSRALSNGGQANNGFAKRTESALS